MNDVLALDADQWVDAYGDALYRFALQRVKQIEVAEDLVQETFLAAVQSRDRFKGQSTEKTWLFSILKHKLIDFYRKQKIRSGSELLTADEEAVDRMFKANGQWQAAPAHWDHNPGKSHEVKEFLDAFYHCLGELPERNARVFAYREIDGLGTTEICERLEITAANCWVILYRARMLLRSCLEGTGFSNPVEASAT
ncbi:MAG: sigma-70 family RNA polymerase sigma factor [Desulfosarcinaceae bacterium]|jgi:RNA polymerase sigma-70 factor (ECF subfamily)